MTTTCSRSTADASSPGIEPPPEVAAVLITGFDRLTLGARDVAARVTVDLNVRLRRLDGGALRPRPQLAIAGTKSENGGSPADRVLESLAAPEVSLSKYRVGVDALHRGGQPDLVEELFVPEH